MQTKYRLFVKANPSDNDSAQTGSQIHRDVLESRDVDAQDVYATMRELEKKYPGRRIHSKMLDPLSV